MALTLDGTAGITANPGTITVTSGTVTTSTPIQNDTQTWNASGVTFTGWKVNITDTASASGSLLADLQVGGSSKFSVRKDGAALASDGTVGSPGITFASDTDSGIYRIGANNIGIGVNGAKVLDVSTTGLGVTGVANASYSFEASGAVQTNAANKTTLSLESASTGRVCVFGADTSTYGKLNLSVAKSNGGVANTATVGNALFGINNTSPGYPLDVYSGLALNSLVSRIYSTNTSINSWLTYVADAEAFNAAAATFQVGRTSTTLRSISAGGTINASGADYAEYETKNASCGVIAKGQIIGFDLNGKITDKWAEAKSFGVKSTNPSYVGGDAWGNEDGLGQRKPMKPNEPQPLEGAEEVTPEQRANYAADLAAYELALERFEAALEDARQKVDRIAYSGKVPVNGITSFNVGDYIIPVQNGDGIGGIAVAEPTFDQYRKAVGQVRRVLPDGRPEIAVKVG